ALLVVFAADAAEQFAGSGECRAAVAALAGARAQVESEAALLALGAVTGDAFRDEQRAHVAGEIDFGGGRTGPNGEQRGDHGGGSGPARVVGRLRLIVRAGGAGRNEKVIPSTPATSRTATAPTASAGCGCRRRRACAAPRPASDRGGSFQRTPSAP